MGYTRRCIGDYGQDSRLGVARVQRRNGAPDDTARQYARGSGDGGGVRDARDGVVASMESPVSSDRGGTYDSDNNSSNGYSDNSSACDVEANAQRRTIVGAGFTEWEWP